MTDDAARFRDDLLRALGGEPDGVLGLAVSGGPDSMAMLALATEALVGRVAGHTGVWAAPGDSEWCAAAAPSMLAGAAPRRTRTSVGSVPRCSCAPVVMTVARRAISLSQHEPCGVLC